MNQKHFDSVCREDMIFYRISFQSCRRLRDDFDLQFFHSLFLSTFVWQVFLVVRRSKSNHDKFCSRVLICDWQNLLKISIIFEKRSISTNEVHIWKNVKLIVKHKRQTYKSRTDFQSYSITSSTLFWWDHLESISRLIANLDEFSDTFL